MFALAKSHDLLVQNEWRSVALHALAREQLTGIASRVRMSGPEVQLPAEVATPLGLILHELATNAVKHGALKARSGRVDLEWEKVEAKGPERLRLTWSEHGASGVTKPTKSGFGSFLLENGIADAEVRRDFRPSGLICIMEIPLAKAG